MLTKLLFILFPESIIKMSDTEAKNGEKEEKREQARPGLPRMALNSVDMPLSDDEGNATQ